MIAVLAVAVVIIITSAGDASTYITFNEAAKMSHAGDERSFHVVGELQKDAAGNIIGIQRGEDKVSFSFVMVDENHDAVRVQYNEPMPPDFTKSEKVVVVGGYKGDQFIAEKILLKCPSKYQEQGQLTLGTEN